MQISAHLHFSAIFDQLVSSFLIASLAQPAKEVAVGKMANYKLMRERKTSAAEQYILRNPAEVELMNHSRLFSGFRWRSCRYLENVTEKILL